MAYNASRPFVPPADYPVDEDSFVMHEEPAMPDNYPFSTFGEMPYAMVTDEPAVPTADYEKLRAKPNTPVPVRAPETQQNRHFHKSHAADNSHHEANRAFMHHIKNHQRFDTMQSFRSCDNCPICRAMEAAGAALTADVAYEAVEPRRASRQAHRIPRVTSPLLSGELFAAPQPIVEEPDDDDADETPADDGAQQAYLQRLLARGVVVGRVTQDRVARRPGELTVVKNEFLEILAAKRRWWNCENGIGQVGVVPEWICDVIKANQ